MLQKNKETKDADERKIDLVLDEDRYKNILDLCDKYNAQHQKNLTPKEYVLMLIDSAIGSAQGSKGE
jgi:hypothetical protein